MIYLWTLVAVACIQAIEYINHTQDSSQGWGPIVLYTGPLIVGCQFGLWKVWSLAPSLLEAWIIFVIINTFARLLMVGALLQGQVASWWLTVLGCCTLLAGGLLVQIGLKYEL